eukprot:491655-Alexandrium_andersonii.AAC.1
MSFRASDLHLGSPCFPALKPETGLFHKRGGFRNAPPTLGPLDKSLQRARPPVSTTPLHSALRRR